MSTRVAVDTIVSIELIPCPPPDGTACSGGPVSGWRHKQTDSWLVRLMTSQLCHDTFKKSAELSRPWSRQPR